MSDFLKNLSVRARNICIDNGLKSELDFLNFVSSNGVNSLYTLRNCGKSTVQELTILYTKLDNQRDSELANLEGLIDNASIVKLIEFSMEDIIKSTSTRTRNLIRKFYGKPIRFQEFIKKEVIQEKSVFVFTSPKSKSQAELLDIKRKVRRLLNEFHSNPNLLKINPDIIELNVALGIMPGNNELNEFTALGNFSVLNFFYDFIFKKDKLNLEQRLYFAKYSAFPLDFLPIDFKKESSKISGVSKERVRQKIEIMKIEIPKLLSGFSRVLNLHKLYSTFIQQKFLFLSEGTFSSYEVLNGIEDLYKISNLFSFLLSDTHYLIMENSRLKRPLEISDTEFYNKKRSHGTNCLIRKDFLSKDELELEVSELYQFLVSRRLVDATYKLKSKNLNHEQIVFLTDFLSKSFALKKQGLDSLLVSSNKSKNDADIIFDILEDSDRPLSLDEIVKTYRNIFPERYSIGKINKKQSLMSSLIRDNRFVVLRGALSSGKSLYGLRSWETKDNRIISGSIVDLCILYLEKSDLPIHQLELSRYVLKHRETNAKNIWTNLKLNKKNVFEFFDGGFIGLKNRKYSSDFIKSLKKINPHDSQTLISFFKNQIYFDLSETIKRFSKEFEIQEIQVESLIHTRLELGQLELEDGKLFYTNALSDDVMSEIINVDKDDLNGYNPYYFNVYDKRILALILTMQNSLNQNLIEEFIRKIEGTKNDWDYCLVVKNDNEIYKTRVFNKTESINLLQIMLSGDNGIDLIKRFHDCIMDEAQVSFENRPRKIFEKLIGAIHKSDHNYTQNKDLLERIVAQLGQRDLTVIESLSIISELYEEYIGESLSLVEARKVYSIIKS